MKKISKYALTPIFIALNACAVNPHQQTKIFTDLEKEDLNVTYPITLPPLPQAAKQLTIDDVIYLLFTADQIKTLMIYAEVAVSNYQLANANAVAMLEKEQRINYMIDAGRLKEQELDMCYANYSPFDLFFFKALTLLLSLSLLK